MKFNNPSHTSQSTSTSFNREGHKVYKNSTKIEFASVLMNAMLKDKFYSSEEEQFEELEKWVDLLLKEGEEKFLCQSMAFVREHGKLRSVSHFLAVKIIENVKGKSFVKKALIKTIQRPDDMTEMVSLWNSRNPKKMIPNSLRKAMKFCLETKWNEYHFKKYACKKCQVKLKDIVKLTHPKPKKFRDKDVFKKVIEDRLDNISTAQTVNRLTGLERFYNYYEMLTKKQLGLMAALKNIKNIFKPYVEHQNSEEKNPYYDQSLLDEVYNSTITELCKLFENKKAIEGSKVLPFRFLQAYEALRDLSIDEFDKKRIKDSLNNGFKISCESVEIPGRTAILLDDSLSMAGKPFYYGKTILAAIAINNPNFVAYLWSDYCAKVDIDPIVNDPLGITADLYPKGYGTFISKPFEEITKTRTKLDNIVVLTDMQMYNMDSFGPKHQTLKSYFDKYKTATGCNPKLVFWDLQGYGDGTPIKLSKDILEMSGISDKMVELLPKLIESEDFNFLVKEIESVEI